MWDRANRLLSHGGIDYAYDGLSNSVSQDNGSVATQYLLDMQPGLVKVLRQSDGSNTDHFIHAPRGLHAQYDGTNWQYIVQDGLGSVRGLIDSTLGVDAAQSYDPYGQPEGSYGAGFGFTGEQTDGNGQVYLRARYYNPGIGVFNSLDPFEGMMGHPMSLNGYSWVEGNPVMNTDPSGQITNLDTIQSLNSGICRQQDGGRLGDCEEQCDYLRPKNILEEIFRGWEPFHSCVDRCILQPILPIGGVGPAGVLFRFDDTEYPQDCENKSAEDCFLYHLKFLSTTKTITGIRRRNADNQVSTTPLLYIDAPLPYDIQMFASFVAPDGWNPHPLGTPGDIKGHYEDAYLEKETPTGRKCISLFGENYGFDFVGNVTFAYIGRAAGFKEQFLFFGAGIAQLADNALGGGGYSGSFRETYGDAPEDMVASRVGSALYDRCGTNCLMEDIEQVVKIFRSEYEEAITSESACQQLE